MFRRLLNKFLKKDFDIDQEHISVFDYHVTMRHVFLIQGVVDGVKRRPLILNLNLVLILLSGVVGMLVLCGTLQHDLQTGDLTEATEVAIYFIMAIFESILAVKFHLGLQAYRSVRDMMERDFWFISSPAGAKYRKNFYSIHLITWKLCTTWTIIIIGICCSFFVKCHLDLILYYALEHAESAERPFTLPLRLPPGYDRNATPYFELLLLMQYIEFICFTQIFLSYNYTLLLIIGHILSQLGMIMTDIEDLFSDRKDISQLSLHTLLRCRIKNIVDRHQNTYKYLEHLAATYTAAIGYAQFVTTPVVCLTAYNFASGLDEHKLYPLMAMLCMGGAVQFLVPCLGLTVVTTKLDEVSEACGRCKWWRGGAPGRCAARDLQIIMARCMRPLPIRVPGFKILNLETFSQALAASYSYFNMLRQVK